MLPYILNYSMILCLKYSIIQINGYTVRFAPFATIDLFQILYVWVYVDTLMICAVVKAKYFAVIFKA